MKTDRAKTKVIFLINEKDGDSDLFAFFPEEEHSMYITETKTSYSHVGQHSACHLDYAREARKATEEEYKDLKAEVEEIGYNLEMVEEF